MVPEDRMHFPLHLKMFGNLRIDAPVLVDLQHGSIRYRQHSSQVTESQNPEVPYEGTQLNQKDHYFYHTRLRSFGPGLDKSQEDAFKFYYVTKGPLRAQGKKLYYVYGQGWDAQDGVRVKPTLTEKQGTDFAWPKKRQTNDLYYDIQIVSQEVQDNNADDEETCLLENIESTPDISHLRLKVKSEDCVSSLKAIVAVKLLKAAANIHVCHNDKELRNEHVLGDLRPQEQRTQALLVLQLTLI
ncbi:uncharacterized protein LOC112573861 isoform X2 [Pomacea canaliculata]|uniref:uncharacterized protein LOC112573861 isoform X2 n=1 Tax=Pomacea canaliculata TaxID=400727 RepID=UPI000D73AB9F|nr:uncharacterized protein LOC112573861 isoform X2 [Pomacea canaliculata]